VLPRQSFRPGLPQLRKGYLKGLLRGQRHCIPTSGVRRPTIKVLPPKFHFVRISGLAQNVWSVQSEALVDARLK
jgi:hypothetical protein